MLQFNTSIAIVDDHPLIVEGLTKLLSQQKNIQIVGTFAKGMDIIPFLKITAVKIILLDITLPDINGIVLCKEIKSIAPNTIVLALSNHIQRNIIMKMLQNGASGYLLKNASLEELLNCLNDALQGHIVFSEEVKKILSFPNVIASGEHAQLTKREKEILLLIAEGKTSSDIASQLFLSKFTVETHRKNLLEKFKVKNVAELIRLATQWDLL